MIKILSLHGREILDSRGRPTVLARCQLDTGVGEASVPSGASTGAGEALELRDGDPQRYRGLGCRKAVANINGEINDALRGMSFAAQPELDARLIALDGTANKSRLGANAVLAVSLAFARASANSRAIPLWRHFAEMLHMEPKSLPRLTINLFSGGKHAGQQVSVQDVLIVPLCPRTTDETLAMTYEVYQSAADLTWRRFGMRLLRADEGGLGPPFRTAEEMLETALDAVAAAGYKPGVDIALAIDVAATHFHHGGRYELETGKLTSDEMIARLQKWTADYPLISVEDGLAEDDWDYWPHLLDAIGSRALVLADDLVCSNPARIERAIRSRAANALLLKVNQVGTLTEAARGLQLVRSAGWSVVVSVRSGETEDTWAADLAVGWGADQFKNGSITQSERLAKLNRLLEIEATTQFPIAPWQAPTSRNSAEWG